ncbi:hypothetical protein HYDPIDRAFT_134382 [Hydnomerulius pinastri MD-312]|uniref:F-box domain-containing protein n=1 Tax=Hydnomerulius pinastri MD-312 TaxID=994086 RepID=A0A0C9VY92_9AGAM|nr:hypothetical protein HYDPIDRAFT_134382 [Hydnomerulius pinastri MD-312]
MMSSQVLSATSIHRCLLIPEIVAFICNIIGEPISDEDPWEPSEDTNGPAQRRDDVFETRTTLLSLAQSCHALKEPALDVLWSNLGSLEPLVRCLPSRIWRRRPGYMHGPLVIERPLLTPDWQIFRGYARRVRSLTVLADQSATVDQSFASAIMGTSETTSLLPNLKYLYWKDQSGALPTLLRFLLNPRLVLLAVNCGTWHLAKEAVISSLGQLCPSLRYLDCRGWDLSENDAARHGICSLQKITHLGAQSIDRRMLIHLSSLHSLSFLDGSLEDTHAPGESSGSIITFSPKLADLYLSASTFAACKNVLQNMLFSPTLLALFVFTLGPGSISQHLPVILNSFTTSLTSVSILIGDLATEDLTDGRASVSFDDFAPLLPCKHLRELEVPSICTSSIDDDTLTRMAKSWPELTTLSFGAEELWRTPPKITLSGLSSLLEHCPLLSSLSIFFTAHVPGELLCDPPKGCTVNEHLNKLCVGASPIVEPLKVAAFLSAILPNVKAIEWLQWEGEEDLDSEVWDYGPRWKQVEDSYALFATVRQQGKNQAVAHTERHSDVQEVE